MTDLETLGRYRLEEAEETLLDAEKMLPGTFSRRSVVNRAYYAMFYAVLALHLHADTKLRTSKHAGVISLFDKEFVKSGVLEPRYSRMLHGIFELRLEGDYKVREEISPDEAASAVRQAGEFVRAVAALMQSKGTPNL